MKTQTIIVTDQSKCSNTGVIHTLMHGDRTDESAGLHVLNKMGETW